MLRNLYRSKEGGGSSEIVRELKLIKNEIKIANDENSRASTPITNATNSPYLPDQNFQYKDVIFNSSEETKWREVKSYEQVREEVAYKNLKKLNII